MRCYACDQENSPDVRFCTGCGTLIAPVTWAQPQPQPQPALGPSQATASYAPPYATPYPQQDPMAQGQGAYPYPYPSGYADPSARNQGAGMPAAAYAPYGYAPGPGPGTQIVNNISVAAQGYSPVVAVTMQNPSPPPLLLRLLYFLFVGLWLGGLWIVLSWLLVASLIGLPLGLYMLNRLPLVMTLTPPPTQMQVTVQPGLVMVQQGRLPQVALPARALYFLFVGWWASLVWLVLAYALIVGTLGLGLPLAFWMVNRVPAITTLAR